MTPPARESEVPRAGRLERAVAWLLLGTALAWGVSVGGTWLEARPWLAEWDRRDVVRLPAPRVGAWRAGDRIFDVRRTDWSQSMFQQSVVALTVRDPDDLDEAARSAVTPAPGWFVRTLRRNDLPGTGAGPGTASAAEPPPPVRTASIIEIQGGWPWRTVVNRSIRFEPGIVIEAMDTPSLSPSGGPQRLPVFPRPWSLVAMGAVVGLLLAWVAGSVGRGWTLRRMHGGRARCVHCGQPTREAAGPRPVRRPGGWAARGRTGLVFVAVAVGGTWFGTAMVAAGRPAKASLDPDGVRWEETRLAGGDPWRMRSTECRGWGHRLRMTTLTPMARRPGTPPGATRAMDGWIAAALTVARPDAGDAGPRTGTGSAVVSVAVGEVTAGWPMPAVRRRVVLGEAVDGEAIDWSPVLARPPVDPVWPGVLVNGALAMALVGAAGWCIAVRAELRRRGRRWPRCPACA